MSHAIAEQLIKAKATVFFATHFRDLSESLSSLSAFVLLSDSGLPLYSALTLGGFDTVQKLAFTTQFEPGGRC